MLVFVMTQCSKHVKPSKGADKDTQRVGWHKCSYAADVGGLLRAEEHRYYTLLTSRQTRLIGRIGDCKWDRDGGLTLRP